MLRYLLLSISCLLLLTACGDGLGESVDDVGDDVLPLLKQGEYKICAKCDLANADLSGADLPVAYLKQVNLNGAKMRFAKLDGVIGADCTSVTTGEGPAAS